MKKFKFYAIITAVVALISLSACSQPANQPQPDFFSQCQKMQKNIEQARSIALDIQHFNWNEFAAIGILCPPQGVCPVGNLPIVEKDSVDKKLLDRVVPLPEQLPTPKTAETYYVQCDNCLKLAAEVCSQSPYNPRAGTAGSENITAQWQQLCSQLLSALQGAEYLASRDKTIAADYTFPKLFAYFTASDENVKQKYLDKFTAKSDEYIKLHDELIHNVQQAKQTATDLSNWQSSPVDATVR
ncbi:MAG: hypothetical protein MUO89_03680 [Dehalococcoidia bacterium]|nr:hypothetical protein [Dehalococcoidia bacterium]